MTRRAVPPGLTCASCTQPFRRALARRTRAGWVCARPCEAVEVLDEHPGRWAVVRGISRWVR